MERRIIKYYMIGLVILTSCYYDSEEKLYPATNCASTAMSLSADITPILERNCYSCHSVGAGPLNGNITLEGYGELMKHVQSGALLGAIKHQYGFSAMPKNASQLGSCETAKIEKWIADGALNN